MKKYKFTKDTFTRTWRTFLQAFLGYVIINIAVIDFSDDKEVLRSSLIAFLVSAVAAGLAAVMNLDKKPDSNGENDFYTALKNSESAEEHFSEEVTDDDV